jgi:hypothetical protein
VICRYDARRLVNDVIEPLGLAEDFAIDADFLTFGIDAGAEFGDDVAINLDTAFADEVFAIAPAADTRGGEDLLQADAARQVFE